MQMSRRKFAAFAVALFFLGGLAVTATRPDVLIVALSAPKQSSGMTLFLFSEESVIDRLGDGHRTAEYAVYYGDRVVYPPGGRGASFPVDEQTGSVFIPYNLFVVGNGEYDVVVRFDGSETRGRVNVEKWANYVYVRPIDRGSVLLVEAALASGTGAGAEDRILAAGELIVEIHYRGKDGREDRTIGSIVTETRNDQTATGVSVPKSRLTQGAGYYSFEPLFHNQEAQNNVQVKGDPTMRNHQPPYNWYYLPELR